MSGDYEDQRAVLEDQRRIYRGGRKHECPTCHKPNALTDEQQRRGYHCDGCTREAEGGGFFP